MERSVKSSLTSYGGRPRPEGSFELYAWFFMRVSGLLLLVLALGHLAIMHLFNSVHTIDYDFVARRWDSLFWRTYDFILLLLAMLHGANGVRYIVDDYIHRPGRRVFALSILYTVTFLFLIIGGMVIFTFRPETVAFTGR